MEQKLKGSLAASAMALALITGVAVTSTVLVPEAYAKRKSKPKKTKETKPPKEKTTIKPSGTIKFPVGPCAVKVSC